MRIHENLQLPTKLFISWFCLVQCVSLHLAGSTTTTRRKILLLLLSRRAFIVRIKTHGRPPFQSIILSFLILFARTCSHTRTMAKENVSDYCWWCSGRPRRTIKLWEINSSNKSKFHWSTLCSCVCSLSPSCSRSLACKVLFNFNSGPFSAFPWKLCNMVERICKALRSHSTTYLQWTGLHAFFSLKRGKQNPYAW